MALGVADIFLAAARGMAGAGGHRLVPEWFISPEGKVSVSVTSEEGRRGLGSRASELLLRRAIPYLEEYIRTGKTPSGVDPANFATFITQNPMFTDAHLALFPGFEGFLPGEGFTGIIPERAPGGGQKSPIGAEDYFMPRFTRIDVPVGGFAGFAQQTVAGQLSSRRRGQVRRRPRVSYRSSRRFTGGTSSGRGYVGTYTRSYKTRFIRGRRKRRAAGTAKGQRRPRLVKGSAAAKRYMAKLRRMRGKGKRRR